MNNEVEGTSVAHAANPQAPRGTQSFTRPSIPQSAICYPQSFLTRRELAAHLKISIRTLDRLVAAGQIPVHRIGRVVRFSLSDVLTRF